MFQYDLFVIILHTKTPYFNQLIQIVNTDKYNIVFLNIHYPVLHKQYGKEKKFAS